MVLEQEQRQIEACGPGIDIRDRQLQVAGIQRALNVLLIAKQYLEQWSRTGLPYMLNALQHLLERSFPVLDQMGKGQLNLLKKGRNALVLSTLASKHAHIGQVADYLCQLRAQAI
ncbi:hypothetical protein D3C86_1628740 [compost metagenome]